jgi:hypothetical protein
VKRGLQIAAVGAGSVAAVAAGTAILARHEAPSSTGRELAGYGTVRAMREADIPAMKALWLRCNPSDATTVQAKLLALMVQNCMEARGLNEGSVYHVLRRGEKHGSLILEAKGEIRGFALIGPAASTDLGKMAYVHVIFLDIPYFGSDLPMVYKRFAMTVAAELEARGFDGLKTITPVRLSQLPGYHADLDGLGIWEKPYVTMKNENGEDEVKMWEYTVWFSDMAPVLTLEMAQDRVEAK